MAAGDLAAEDQGDDAAGHVLINAGERVRLDVEPGFLPDLAAQAVGDGLVEFEDASPAGGPLRHTNFRRRFWVPALAAAGLPSMHFHDLRHTGNMLAADAGVNLRELMDRMGHATTRAATAYLHGGDERQQAIADELSRQAAQLLGRSKKKPSGTQRARQRRTAS